MIAATNADLAQAIEEKTFRLDLFYRLNVDAACAFRPCASARRTSRCLADHFLKSFAERSGGVQHSLDAEAVRALEAQDYPRQRAPAAQHPRGRHDLRAKAR